MKLITLSWALNTNRLKYVMKFILPRVALLFLDHLHTHLLKTDRPGP